MEAVRDGLGEVDAPADAGSVAGRIGIAVYGVAAYGAFFGVFVYLALFVGGLWVPKSLYSGEPAPLAAAVVMNTLLVLLFGFQHAVMARPWFKAAVTRVIPRAAERSTFVLAASVCLTLLYWLWQPMPQMVWEVENAWARGALWVVFAAGWLLVLGSSFVISHFDLFGLRQVVLNLIGRRYEPLPFQVVGPYRLVRHPLMLGFLMAFWSAPTMSLGRLLFAGVMTAYILAGIRMEERDLVRAFGEGYRQYRRYAPALFPRVAMRRNGEAA